MTQKRLANVAIAFTWTTLVGALAGVLNSLGESRPVATLMGVTGHAFRLALTEADGVLAGSPAATAVDFGRALPLYANAGRNLELITADTTASDFPRRREEALKKIRRSIDRRRPAIAYDLHLPEFGVISGYDDRAHTLFVSSMMSG